jgi:hypothetical protein
MLIDVLWLAVLAYCVLQVVVLVRAKGAMRWAAAVPLLVMVPVVVLTVIALARASNLWPLLLLFAGPVALLYVAVVAVILWARPKAAR